MKNIAKLAYLLILLSLGRSVITAEELTADQKEFFENKIRPLLTSNCYQCHSIEAGKAKAGLTLDTPEGMKKGGEGGPLFVPGDPANSVIIRAVSYTDPDLQMPPNNRMSDQEIADLTAWIKMGAPDPRQSQTGKLTGLTEKARNHWAYKPVTDPTPPQVKNAEWCQSPVDRFILAKLEEKGLTPSAPATKEALIRRAYYDLIGLPPSPMEIEAFKNDQRPDAFARVVDQLLAAPEYGERWGRHWLDTARYADTIGGDLKAGNNLKVEYRYPYAWTYRDYVIDSINQDKPYNRFILEQLAADQLPESQNDPSILAGLGFLTVGTRFKDVNDDINERIDVVTKGFLASTVTCARCHDHRFDPIPTTDYYALHGIFASVRDPKTLPTIKLPDQEKLAEFQQKVAALDDKNRTAYENFIASLNADFLQHPALYLSHTNQPRNGKPSAEELLALQKESTENGLDPTLSLVIRGVLMRQPVGDNTFSLLKNLATIPSAEFAQRAPVTIANMIHSPEINPLVAAAFATAHITSFNDVVTIYGNLFTLATPLSRNYLHAAFATESVVKSDNFTNTAMEPGPRHFGPRIQVPGIDPNLIPFLNFPFPATSRSKLDSTTIRELIAQFPQRLRRKLARTNIDFNTLNEMELTDPGAPEKAMVVEDIPKAHDSPVFIRGQEQVRGATVPRHFLTILSPEGKPTPYTEGSGRLELAQDIASRANPLTARVMVNRVWMYHFGTGFVSTPDDLGNQSEPPSHPELLDYLSTYFMDNGWSLKKLHRLIMLSSVYQESINTTKESVAADPENRLLAHASVRRLDFESLRDSLLLFSGKLDRKIGGQPVNLTDEPYSYRRSVYGYIDRGNLPELMNFFDFSDPDMVNSHRSSTIVPQQALFLMNSPMIVEVVRDILDRQEIAGASNDLQKIATLYLIIFQRYPRDLEVNLAQQFLAKQEEEIDLSPTLVKKQPNKPSNFFLDFQKRLTATQPIQNQGERVARTTLTPWESLTQAMLFANEMSYIN